MPRWRGWPTPSATSRGSCSSTRPPRTRRPDAPSTRMPSRPASYSAPTSATTSSPTTPAVAPGVDPSGKRAACSTRSPRRGGTCSPGTRSCQCTPSPAASPMPAPCSAKCPSGTPSPGPSWSSGSTATVALVRPSGRSCTWLAKGWRRRSSRSRTCSRRAPPGRPAELGGRFTPSS
uniref:Uncharacterized protein n=1 Tax=Arundo donax TaxID=35708 RepID=A0A0A9H1S0_ARUDO